MARQGRLVVCARLDRRYPTGNHDDCMVAFLRAYKLIHADEMTGGPYNPALARAFGNDIDDCQFNRTKPYLACLAAATTADAVRTCMAGPTW